MIEIWKDILGYDNLYQVSNFGNVRSLDNYQSHWRGGKRLRKGRVLKQRNDKKGYKYVILSKDWKVKYYKVHRIVAQAFIPNPENLPQVNHKDENKSNNCVDNLEWCDAKYNTNYGTRNERISNSLKSVWKYKDV